VLTDAEMADLVQVGDLLDLSTVTITAALERPPHPVAEHAGATAGTRPGFELAPGDLIALTGDMSRPREQIEATLIAHGFIPWRAVTKKVRLLVAADPDSLSGKARKARDYGIPI